MFTCDVTLVKITVLLNVHQSRYELFGQVSDRKFFKVICIIDINRRYLALPHLLCSMRVLTYLCDSDRENYMH